MRLGIITVSVREGRIGDKIANWAYQYAKKSGTFEEVELIDLKDLDLPVFSEPNHPMMQDYTQEKTKQWAAIVERMDAYIFVTPEYDYFAPSSLVNAFQYLAKEWNYKPAGFVGYGGLSGGLRSIQAAKPLLTTSNVMPIPESVAFQFAWNDLKEDSIEATATHEESADGMLAALRRWAEALSPMR